MSLIDSLQHKVKRKVTTYEGLGARLRATLDWDEIRLRTFRLQGRNVAIAALATSAEAHSVSGSVAS